MTPFKFAFIFMCRGFNHEKQNALINHNGTEVSVYGVDSLEEAVELSKKLLRENVKLIELCGAFCEDGARKIIEATDNKVAVGFVTHSESEEEKFKALFG